MSEKNIRRVWLINLFFINALSVGFIPMLSYQAQRYQKTPLLEMMSKAVEGQEFGCVLLFLCSLLVFIYAYKKRGIKILTFFLVCALISLPFGIYHVFNMQQSVNNLEKMVKEIYLQLGISYPVLRITFHQLFVGYYVLFWMAVFLWICFSIKLRKINKKQKSFSGVCDKAV